MTGQPIACPRDGSTTFYLARFYNGAELRTVKGVRRNDAGQIEVWAGDVDSDEYTSIESVSLMCEQCKEPVEAVTEDAVTFDPIMPGENGWGT